MYDDDHPSFQRPADPDVKIWRYMDFTKFVSLLDRQEIFFVKSDKLDDPFEGALPRRTFETWSSGFIEDPGLESVRATISAFAVNSWHMNDYESAAMWRMYVRGNEGIAITSTFDKLSKSFHKSERPQFIGIVRYIDYDRETIHELRGNTMNFITYKRRSFEFERELRAVVSSLALLDAHQRTLLNVTEQHIEQESQYNDVITESGIYIPIDVDMLIDEIYVSPTAQAWFVELVQSITELHSLAKPIHKSSLSDDPVY